jgi:hypothetical protein
MAGRASTRLERIIAAGGDGADYDGLAPQDD